MKREIMSFSVEPMKPRNRVAQDMFDRSGPYKAKVQKDERRYQRREKHRSRQEY